MAASHLFQHFFTGSSSTAHIVRRNRPFTGCAALLDSRGQSSIINLLICVILQKVVMGLWEKIGLSILYLKPIPTYPKLASPFSPCQPISQSACFEKTQSTSELGSQRFFKCSERTPKSRSPRKTKDEGASDSPTNTRPVGGLIYLVISPPPGPFSQAEKASRPGRR